MTKKIDDESRVRRAYSARGTRGQKMFNFRLDLDLYEQLQHVQNKGRLVNDAIRAHLQKLGGD